MSYQIITGDCRDVLRTMADKSAHCCVTSPPYFGLRDYGMTGQMGMEQTPEAFVEELVAVFREVRRVLRDDGTLWLNLGDSYARGFGGGTPGEKSASNVGSFAGRKASKVPDGLKGKDLIGIPWRVALALQADGWYLRQDIIWHKPNPMPESVTDRCTKSHEYVFLLSKSSRYYFDHEAIKEPSVGGIAGNVKPTKGAQAYLDGDEKHRTKLGLSAWADKQRTARDSFKREGSKREKAIPGQTVGTHRPDRAESDYPLETRNKRSVWTVSTRPFKGAHFATFPEKLIEPCILAGCPEDGTVLDPFGGACTTSVVAERLGRNSVMIEMNPEYAALGFDRLFQAECQVSAA